MLLLLLSLWSGDPVVAPEPVPAEDCALYDVIRREQLGPWVEAGNGRLRVAAGPRGRYLQCPGWAAGEGAPTEVVEFEPPAYSRRLASVSVDFSVLYFNHHRDPWVVTGRSMHRCEFHREASTWRFKQCRLIAQSR